MNTQQKRGRGRPAKPGRYKLEFHVPIADALLIKQEAQSRGLSISDYVGFAVLRHAKRGVKGLK